MADAISDSDDGSPRTVNVSIDELAPLEDQPARRMRGRRRLQNEVRRVKLVVRNLNLPRTVLDCFGISVPDGVFLLS